MGHQLPAYKIQTDACEFIPDNQLGDGLQIVMFTPSTLCIEELSSCSQDDSYFGEKLHLVCPAAVCHSICFTYTHVIQHFFLFMNGSVQRGAVTAGLI